MITIEIENENEVSIEDDNLHLLNFNSANVVKKVTHNEEETQTTTISNEDGEAYLETSEGTKTYHVDLTPDGLITKKTVNGNTVTSRIATLEDVGDAENDVIDGYYYNGAFYSDSQHTQLITAREGKIYIDIVENLQYRFNGSIYVELTTDTSNLQTKITNDNKLNADLVENGTTNKVYTATEQTKLSGIESGAQVNTITSVNTKTGAVVLDADDISDTSTTNKFVTTTEKNTWNAKQDALTSEQLSAINSGINSTKVSQIDTNTTNVGNIQAVIPVQATVNNQLTDKASAVGSIEMSINPTTYVLTLQAKNVNGQNIGSAQTADLPLESIILSAIYYNSYTYNGTTYSKVIVITLATTDVPTIIPVGGLVSGLQNEITSQNKLSADLVDDTNATNKFVTASDKTNWNGKQDALTAGNNVTISNNVISATDTTYIAGNGLNLNNGEFSVDNSILPSGFSTAEMETICEDILYPALPAPQNVSISDTTISFDEVEGATSYEVFADGVSIGEYEVGGE